jgi:hypothetical protein
MFIGSIDNTMKDRSVSLAVILLSGIVLTTDGFLISLTSPAQSTSSNYRGPQLLAVENNDNNDDGDDAVEAEKKSKTRLAQLAEDWLEEEEEDELLQYWERFDAKEVAVPTKNKPTSLLVDDSSTENYFANATTVSTEERLERYFDRRGINKQKEKEHAN